MAKVQDKVEDAQEAVQQKTQEVKKDVTKAKDQVVQKTDDVVTGLKRQAEVHSDPNRVVTPEDPDNDHLNPLDRVLRQRNAQRNPIGPLLDPRKALAGHGRCPWCGIEVHFASNAKKMTNCGRCGGIFTPAQARAAAQSAMQGRFGR